LTVDDEIAAQLEKIGLDAAPPPVQAAAMVASAASAALSGRPRSYS
jgi:hypothetical protein